MNALIMASDIKDSVNLREKTLAGTLPTILLLCIYTEPLMKHVIVWYTAVVTGGSLYAPSISMFSSVINS